MPRGAWIETYGHTIDDVRAALDWAFSTLGDDEIAAGLTAASLPFGVQLSLIDEMKRRTELAIRIVAKAEPPRPESELRLVSALATISLNASISSVEDEALFNRLAELSKIVGIPKYQIAPLSARAIGRLETGDLAGAADLTDQLWASALQADDPLATLLADRVGAQVHQFLGDHPRAKTLAERVLRHPAKVIPLAYSQTPIDRRISMRIVLARSLWIEGDTDQALGMVEECMNLARPEGPLPATFALAMAACPLALWTGDNVGARRLAEELVANARRYTLVRWERLGECYLSVLDRRALKSAGRQPNLDLPTIEPATQMQRELLATFDLDAMDSSLALRAEAGLCGWCNPELLRAAGEMYLRNGSEQTTLTAEAHFKTAIDQARHQGALAWELRAATSLAGLLDRQAKTAPAREILLATLERISQGRDTVDVKIAVRLANKLGAQL
jgi:hypothetical protein